VKTLKPSCFPTCANFKVVPGQNFVNFFIRRSRGASLLEQAFLNKINTFLVYFKLFCSLFLFHPGDIGQIKLHKKDEFYFTKTFYAKWVLAFYWSQLSHASLETQLNFYLGFDISVVRLIIVFSPGNLLRCKKSRAIHIQKKKKERTNVQVTLSLQEPLVCELFEKSTLLKG